MGLKLKILSLTLSISMLVLMVGGVGYYTNVLVTKSYGIVANDVLPKQEYLGVMLSSINGFRANLRSVLIESYLSDQKPAVFDQISSSIDTYDETYSLYVTSNIDQEEQKHLDQVVSYWSKLKPLSEKILEITKKNEAISKEEISQILNEEISIATVLQKSIEDLIKFNDLAAAKAVENSKKISSYGLWVLLFLIGFGSILSMMIAVVFSAHLGTSIKNTAISLTSGANLIKNAADKVTETSVDLSSSATMQAAALCQTSSAIKSISDMVYKNAEGAKESSAVSLKSQKTAELGSSIVSQMLKAMGDISNSNKEIMTQIEKNNKETSDIVKIINEISDKTMIINDIVFQTKLLSFNASVEASRAGEHGKGFSVVAEEVGNLAHISGSAAEEISSLLATSIQKVQDMISATSKKIETLIKDGKEKLETGNSIAEKCRSILNEIVDLAKDVNQKVINIAQASDEQSKSLHEVTKEILKMNEVTEKNTKYARSSSDAAKELSEQVISLRSFVKVLAFIVSGKKS